MGIITATWPKFFSKHEYTVNSEVLKTVNAKFPRLLNSLPHMIHKR